MTEGASIPNFQKAARCEAHNCVEVALLGEDGALVRDSKKIDGPILAFGAKEWGLFIKGAKNGEFSTDPAKREGARQVPETPVFVAPVRELAVAGAK